VKARPTRHSSPPHRAARLALAASVCVALACGRHHPPPAPAQPHETLLLILADFRRVSETDIYRHAIPRDITGQNYLRATLARLDSYERAYPGRDADIVDFVRAQAYARLGEFALAIDAYGRVSDTEESELAARASERIDALIRLRNAAAPSPQGRRLDHYLVDLERRAERLSDFADDATDDDPEAFDAVLARREIERVEVERALALFRNRYVVDNGAARAIDLAGELIERHARSHNVQAHRLMLGRFHFELARDMTVLTPPDRLGFDTALCFDLIATARDLFLTVSQADGYDEKLEAAALLDEIEAFARKVRQRAR